MNAIMSALVGDREHIPFEQRVFHFVMLVAALMTAVGTALDLYYQVPGTIIIDLLFWLCWVAAYLLSRAGRKFIISSKTAIAVLIFLFSPYLWITSGGLMSGPLLCFYLFSVAVVCTILTGCFRLSMLLSTLVVVLGMMCYDVFTSTSPIMDINRFIFYMSIAVQFLMLMAATAALILVYSSMYMKEKALNETGAKTIEEQYRQQLYTLESMEQLVMRLKSERHDFNNHLGVIFGLLQSGEPESAGEYTARLVSAAEDYHSLVSIPYPTLRAILNYKLSIAQEAHIDLRLDVNIPSDLALNELDLAVIFGNLMDNVIEANRKLAENRRYLKLRLDYKPDYLLIGTENPYDNTALGRQGRSSKAQPEEHGFGLQNIAYLIKKHSGCMNIEPDGSVFRVELALLAEKTSAK